MPVDYNITESYFLAKVEKDILYIKYMSGLVLTVDIVQKEFDFYKKHFTDKFYLIIDVSVIASATSGVRSFRAEQGIFFYKGVAPIANSILTKYLANLFFFINKPNFPLKIVKSVMEAKAFIAQLKNDGD